MSKLELFISIAMGQISSAITLLKRKEQTPKVQRWIKGLKAASAGLSELMEDED